MKIILLNAIKYSLLNSAIDFVLGGLLAYLLVYLVAISGIGIVGFLLIFAAVLLFVKYLVIKHLFSVLATKLGKKLVPRTHVIYTTLTLFYVLAVKFFFKTPLFVNLQTTGVIGYESLFDLAWANLLVIFGSTVAIEVCVYFLMARFVLRKLPSSDSW